MFQHETIRKLMQGRPVITIIGSRNMWVMAQEKIKVYITGSGGRLVGNIMLYDKAPNLLSVISVIRWMFKGKKDRFGIIPPSGVSQEDISSATRFGHLIREFLLQQNFTGLQEKLAEAGAVDVKPELVMIEKRGIVMFRLWADFILKKGPYGSKSRLARIRLFKYYLLTVIYLVSPFATLLFMVTRPFRQKAIRKQVSLYQS
jgi:hypothetical protein